MIEVRTIRDADIGSCAANNVSCEHAATVDVCVQDSLNPLAKRSESQLCVKCARELFNALGFIIMSQTGESIQRLVGLTKRRGDK